MNIQSIHPKFLSDPALEEEHALVHRLFDALSGQGPLPADPPDLFRFRGRRGRLYVRHRMLVEEDILRGRPHTTLMDRRVLESEEWVPVEVDPEAVRAEAAAVAAGAPGRVPLPPSDDVAALTGAEEVCSAIDVVVDQEILLGLWLRYRHLVMERSYPMYRQLADPLRGRGRGAVYMLFDILLEEAFARDPEESAPRITYESIWEMLEPEADRAEREEFARQAAALRPGAVSLPMRRFLASAAARQGHGELLKARILSAYL